MPDTVVYRLSTVDQSIIRTYYHRVCLCFPCANDEPTRQHVTDALTRNLKRAVSHMPIFAGTVHPCPSTPFAPSALRERSTGVEKGARRTSSVSSAAKPDDDDVSHVKEARRRRGSSAADSSAAQRGRVEVRVSAEDVSGIQPTTVSLMDGTGSCSYADMRQEGMPAARLAGLDLGPLPDTPEAAAHGSHPVTAVQASFVHLGVLVSISVHRSVADILGIGTLIRHMCGSDDTAAVPDVPIERLQEDAVEHSRIRDRLSGSRGVKARAPEPPERSAITRAGRGKSVCRVLSFDTGMLDEIRAMVRARGQVMHDRPEIEVSRKDCLAAILWKALTRARWLGSDEAFARQPSSLRRPVSIRGTVEPALEESYVGNASLWVHSTAPVIQLCLPFDVGSIASIAQLVHSSTVQLTDAKVRSLIARVNAGGHVRGVVHQPAADLGTDVSIADWTDLLPAAREAGLGLGLGEAEFVRQAGRHHSDHACVLLPVKAKTRRWEVLVHLAEEAMEKLLEDAGLGPLIRHVA